MGNTRRRGYAVILAALRLLVSRCASFTFACPVGVPRPRNSEFPSNHAEFELSTKSRGTTARTWGLTEAFLGVMIVPLVGNVAENLVAVQSAMANKMDLSLSISLGSSLQVALFVAPVLVFVSLLAGHPLSLLFNVYELSALAVAVGIATFIAQDGESNWLEGVQLLAVYAILGIAFFLLPSGG